MSKNDAFVKKFRRLLAEIDGDTSLAQWQHMYRQAIIEMGLTIGDKFKAQAARVGHGNPIEDAEAGGHHGPGPHLVLQLAEYALGIGYRFR